MSISSWTPSMSLFSHDESKSSLLINLLNLVDYRLVVEICLITVVGAHVYHSFSSILPIGRPS